MKRFLKILPLILIYLLSTAKSCDDGERSNKVAEEILVTQTKDSIGHAFDSRTLDEPSLRAFEASALIKMNDLSDYIRIICDTTADPAFRKKAGEMVAGLFIKGKSLPEKLMGAVFDSVFVLNPLKSSGDSMYSGQLGFRLTNYYAGLKMPGTYSGVIDIYTIKQKKVFGKDTIPVWNVFLASFGDLRQTRR